MVHVNANDGAFDDHLDDDGDKHSPVSSKTCSGETKLRVQEQDDHVDDSIIFSTTEESMQLSLPDSFDDTLTLNGIPILPVSKGPPAEIQLLQVQLLQARQELKDLTHEKELNMNAITNVMPVDEERLQQIQNLPPNQRTLAQHACLTIHMAIESEKRELHVTRERLTNAMELAEQQKEKASNAQILCEQRISNMQETLDAAKDRQGELEMKIKDQQDTILELKEKGRMYDEMVLEKNSLLDEVTRLRIMMEQKQTQMDSLQKQDHATQSKVDELKRTVQSLEMDKSFFEKEKSILLERADRAEVNNKKSNEALREAMLKSDNLTLQLAEANTAAKSNYDDQYARDTKKIREESELEVKKYREQVEGSYEREIQLLKDSKTELTGQLEKVNGELDRIRASLERVTAEKSSTIVALERSLSDCRSDLKIKCVESTRLQITNETLEQDLKSAQRNNQMLTDQVEVHKSEFSNLEQESLFERKRLMDEIARKDDQLETYYHSQSQVHTKGHKYNPGEIRQDINPSHLLDRSATLSKKCGTLKKQIASLQGQLKKQVAKARHYESKYTHVHRTLDHISNKKSKDDEPSSIAKEKELISSSQQVQVQAQAMEIQNLLTQNASLRDDLATARQERDKLSQEFSFLLNKYHNLVDSGVTRHHLQALPLSHHHDSHLTPQGQPRKVIHHAGKIRRYSSSPGNPHRRGEQGRRAQFDGEEKKNSTPGRTIDMSKHTTHHASVMNMR